MPAQSWSPAVQLAGSYSAARDFAIADFDGDRFPDLASIEAETRNSSGATTYSIRFRLASGTGQAFGITAPTGGLQLVAQDVNGDNAPDVLVSTAWEHHQVALFLNDGHGNFAPADVAAFPAAAAVVNGPRWVEGQIPYTETGILLPSQDSTSGLVAHRGWRGREPKNRLQLGADKVFRMGLLPAAGFGRAPPLLLFTA